MYKVICFKSIYSSLLYSNSQLAQCLIYNIVEDNLEWKMLKLDDYKNHQTTLSDDEKVLDSSYAHINNNPVGVKLVEKGDDYILKVNL